jgi:hypothetical protein
VEAKEFIAPGRLAMNDPGTPKGDAVMPNVDDRVKSKGCSFARQLTGSRLAEMAQRDELYILRDDAQEPAMVLAPYRIYLELQRLAELSR